MILAECGSSSVCHRRLVCPVALRRLGIDPAVGGNQFTQDGTFLERDPIIGSRSVYRAYANTPLRVVDSRGTQGDIIDIPPEPTPQPLPPVDVPLGGVFGYDPFAGIPLGSTGIGQDPWQQGITFGHIGLGGHVVQVRVRPPEPRSRDIFDAPPSIALLQVVAQQRRVVPQKQPRLLLPLPALIMEFEDQAVSAAQAVAPGMTKGEMERKTRSIWTAAGNDYQKASRILQEFGTYEALAAALKDTGREGRAKRAIKSAQDYATAKAIIDKAKTQIVTQSRTLRFMCKAHQQHWYTKPEEAVSAVVWIGRVQIYPRFWDPKAHASDEARQIVLRDEMSHFGGAKEGSTGADSDGSLANDIVPGLVELWERMHPEGTGK